MYWREDFARYLSNKFCNHEHFVFMSTIVSPQLVFFRNYCSFFCHLLNLMLRQISSRFQDSLTIKVKVLHFSTEKWNSAQQLSKWVRQAPLPRPPYPRPSAVYRYPIQALEFGLHMIRDFLFGDWNCSLIL